MIDLNKYSHVYLLGIAGIGMSALARYFNFKDKLVFGYDRKKSDLSIELESEGISIHYNDNISKIPRKIINSKKEDTLIIYTPAINTSNKEYVYFKKEGFQLYKRAQVLAKISEDFYTIA
ncbi:MAG: UDP-N-acetylmuramate--L-alanine ligase, partial [Flavobacteriales bacterium]|nr:UDP-N-acetylmuramate--L-alanine ligase [Flavobacteriales bacterium]